MLLVPHTASHKAGSAGIWVAHPVLGQAKAMLRPWFVILFQLLKWYLLISSQPNTWRKARGTKQLPLTEAQDEVSLRGHTAS